MAESRLTPTEGETLAVVDALEKTSQRLPQSDYCSRSQSLLKFIGNRSLEAIPNLQQPVMQLQTLSTSSWTHNHLSLPDDANLVSNDNKLPTIPHSFYRAIRAQSDMPTLCSSEEDSLGGVSSIIWNDINVHQE
ncbi:hypothetical protein PoB_005948300 [Plakobranchus ocellatus]|uniref:Uncharacterized protein n=1 Tax=Plakobranchus ocellatus TaxID=259542 RepID=A0AAV4CLH6_9GAST|nr:hypothetical protein PoB_005948300 [Plakobranchus ocellatus]